MNEPIYQVTMLLSRDELETLKTAVLAYSKSKAVTMKNWDHVRELYGKFDPAWAARKGSNHIAV